ncbi:hypothetical protein KM295_02225 [Natronomonas sp. F2-12]|jgi:hypothetical protein|uniref:Uncharacterized protein n=1 Tax=Natronomonas aquatica TaxID=2841590 RepID=A0A9R1CR47_9EURY|nr:hypothetical protein [Natronomonas aquatica]MCQ4332322.1 hypothetical protein [Natronomonas aquatica]
MGLRGILFWPIYRLADWVDDNPVSAVGALLALGALAALLASALIGTGTGAGGPPLDSSTAGLLAETAIERPAYPVAALVGFAVVLFYKG